MSHKSREVVAATGALYESVGLLLIIRPTYIVGPHLGQRFSLLVRCCGTPKLGLGLLQGISMSKLAIVRTRGADRAF